MALHEEITVDSQLHYPKAFAGAANNSFPVKMAAGTMEWFSRTNLPIGITTADSTAAPATEVSGDIYLLGNESGTLVASAINWSTATTSVITFSGSPDLSAHAAADYLIIIGAADADWNGSWIISAADNGAKTITFTNANVTDATQDETTGATATVTLADWDGSKQNSWARFNGTVWESIVPTEGYTCYLTTDSSLFEFDGTDWVNATESGGIYDGSGSLSANTVVTQGANTLDFTTTAVDGFSIDGTTFSVDGSNNRVGIGTVAPSEALHVVGDSYTTGFALFGGNTTPAANVHARRDTGSPALLVESSNVSIFEAGTSSNQITMFQSTVTYTQTGTTLINQLNGVGTLAWDWRVGSATHLDMNVVAGVTRSYNNFVVYTSQGVSNDSFVSSEDLILRGKYDSDTGAGTTSADYDATLVNTLMTAGASPSSRLSFKFAGSEKVSFMSGGSVGIGTTAPTTLFNVATTAPTTDSILMQSATATADGSSIAVYSSRGTIATPTATNSADDLGNFEFHGFTDAQAVGASIKATATELWSATAAGSKLGFYTTDNTTLVNDVRMTIDENGEVGIGTVAPASQLHVVGDIQTANVKMGTASGGGSEAYWAHVNNYTSTSYALFNGATGSTALNAKTGRYITLEINRGIALAVNSSKQIGIGDISINATTMLHVGTTAPTTDMVLMESATATTDGSSFATYSHRGSIATATATNSGDDLGNYLFQGYTNAKATGALIKATATELWSATAAGSKLGFYTTDNTTLVNDLRMTIDNAGNVGIGTETFGTSAVGVLGIAIGTEPSTEPAGIVQVYAKDSSVGSTDATIALGLETDPVVIGTFTASHKIPVWVNGVEYHIQLDAV